MEYHLTSTFWCLFGAEERPVAVGKQWKKQENLRDSSAPELLQETALLQILCERIIEDLRGFAPHVSFGLRQLHGFGDCVRRHGHPAVDDRLRVGVIRSEERRVGKEGRSRWSP